MRDCLMQNGAHLSINLPSDVARTDGVMCVSLLLTPQEDTMERTRVGLKRVRKRLTTATKQAKGYPWLVLMLFVFGLCFGVYFLSRIYRML